MTDRTPNVRLAEWRQCVSPDGQSAVLQQIIVDVAVSGGHPWLAFFVIPLGIAALGGGAAAVVSIVRRGERGALVMMPLVVGLLALVFVAGELIVPH